MPRSVAASMMFTVACPRSYISSSWWRVSSGCLTTKATVAADRATCRAPCQTFASSTSCERSVTTTKFHGCQLLADADLRPASRMRSRSARAIGWSVYCRTLRRARMVSQVSMSQLYACTPARAGAEVLPAVRAESRAGRRLLGRAVAVAAGARAGSGHPPYEVLNAGRLALPSDLRLMRRLPYIAERSVTGRAVLTKFRQAVATPGT